MSHGRGSLWRQAERRNVGLGVAGVEGLLGCQQLPERLAGLEKGLAPLHGWFPCRRSPGGLSQSLRWPPSVLGDEPRVQMERLWM